jgi:flavin reductase (DIM6/NTAB) family NADH-FMN oxidoreductase RutF
LAANKQLYRKVMGRFATGVTVLTVPSGNETVRGMTANSFTSVSLDPMLVLVCVDYRARTLALMQASARFGISVLAEEQQALSDYFAGAEQDQETAARLGVRFRVSRRGTPLLEGCLATIDCRKVAAHVAGDHTVFIGEVDEMAARDGRPLLFYSGRYHRLGE